MNEDGSIFREIGKRFTSVSGDHAKPATMPLPFEAVFYRRVLDSQTEVAWKWGFFQFSPELSEIFREKSGYLRGFNL